MSKKQKNKIKKYIVKEVKKGLQLSNRIVVGFIAILWLNAGIVLGFIHWMDYISPTMKIY